MKKSKIINPHHKTYDNKYSYTYLCRQRLKPKWVSKIIAQEVGSSSTYISESGIYLLLTTFPILTVKELACIYDIEYSECVAILKLYRKCSVKIAEILRKKKWTVDSLFVNI